MREEGYYWVKQKYEGSEWEVAKWYVCQGRSPYWILFQDDDKYPTDSELLINENRIKILF